VVGTGALEELKLDDRLLQENKAKSQNKKRCSKIEKQNNSPTRDKGRIIILIFLILRHGNHSAI